MSARRKAPADPGIARRRELDRAWAAARDGLVHALPDAVEPEPWLAQVWALISDSRCAAFSTDALISAACRLAEDGLAPLDVLIRGEGDDLHAVPTIAAMRQLVQACIPGGTVRCETVMPGDHFETYRDGAGAVMDLTHQARPRAPGDEWIGVWGRVAPRAASIRTRPTVLMREEAEALADSVIRLPFEEPAAARAQRALLLRLARGLTLEPAWAPVRRMERVFARISTGSGA
jgi:hypothetical protein